MPAQPASERDTVAVRPPRRQMFERRLYFHIDWLLLGGDPAARRHRPRDDLQHHLRRSHAGRRHRARSSGRSSTPLGLGLFALLVVPGDRLPAARENSLFLYVGLLRAADLRAVHRLDAVGAQRWISLGPFNLQPSEFVTIALALVLAMFFGENSRGARNTGDLVIGRHLHAACRSCSSPSSPTSARR